MSTSKPVFEHSVRAADEWLRSVARAFDTDDLNFAHRALRAWLHALRDELSVESAAHFAAQLPELLRGMFYEGWDPRHVPSHRDLDAFVERFAHEALVRPSEVGHVAATVTAGLREHLAPDFLASVLHQLPHRLRQLIGAPSEAHMAVASHPPDDRFARLESEVRTVTEALRELVHGLEQTPLGEPEERAMAAAAHRAHQILLSAAP